MFWQTKKLLNSVDKVFGQKVEQEMILKSKQKKSSLRNFPNMYRFQTKQKQIDDLF